MEFTKDKTRSLIKKLRLVAEKQLQTKQTKLYQPEPEKDLLKLVHELEVHQIELEMQNEELLKVSEDLENVLEKYTDLYEFSPISYFNIASNGNIIAMNMAGAKLLSVERSQLTGRRFIQFVAPEDHSVFTSFMDNVLNSHIKENKIYLN